MQLRVDIHQSKLDQLIKSKVKSYHINIILLL